ncbi:MAG: response regulator transcription factor [Bacteroidota bacterium]
METILIADDHEIVRRGVKTIVESLPQKYNYIEASTCTEVAQLLNTASIQYAVLDMFLADGMFFSAMQYVPESNTRTNILVYSMSAEKIYAKRLMQKGVKGFVSKQSSIEELEIAIRCLLKGEIYLSGSLKQNIFGANKPDVLTNPIDLLSDRELEVIEYINTGIGTKEIAQKMNLDITTISTYRRRAFEKLDVDNMIELKEKFMFHKSQR